MIEIQIRYDRKRGCGWRKPGAKYLIAGSLSAPCGKLPHFLTFCPTCGGGIVSWPWPRRPVGFCPTCGGGIKPMRGWRWIDAALVFAGVHCDDPTRLDCQGCILADPPHRAGLIWIGDTFYSPEEFVAEAEQLGISRRIACVPKGFEVGKTLVLVASRHVPRYGTNDALFQDLPTRTGPAIFAAFIPRAIDYVVKGTESQEELERLVKQGCTLVKVERVYPDARTEGACGEPAVAGSSDLRARDHGAADGPADGGRDGSASVCEVPPAAHEGAAGGGDLPAAEAAG